MCVCRSDESVELQFYHGGRNCVYSETARTSTKRVFIVNKMAATSHTMFKMHFLEWKCVNFHWKCVKIPLKFVPKGPINNIPALVQIMAWRRPGDKPLSEPMMVFVPTHICVTRPQWVKNTLKTWTTSKFLGMYYMIDSHYISSHIGFPTTQISIHSGHGVCLSWNNKRGYHIFYKMPESAVSFDTKMYP